MSTVNADVTPLTVLIVGCGNIAGGFDMGRPPGFLPFTHAGAYARDNRFKLAACVEPDDRRRDEFMSSWSVPQGYRSIDELLEYDKAFDVISICSPTSCHGHDLEVALRLKPRLIFCEKPVTTSLEQTSHLVQACSQANIPLAVNYTRRWDPAVISLQRDMHAAQWGELRSVSGLYNKGVLNNGSHMLDLLHFLMGPMAIVKVGKPVNDYLDTDPSVPVWLEGENGVPVHLACGHAEDYALFELQLVFSGGVLSMEEGGMFWRERRRVDSDTFKGYRKLDEGIRQPGAYPRAMLMALDNIYRAVFWQAALASNGQTALAAQRLCEEIKQQACAL